MREANDRGYECIIVTDATESYNHAYKEAAIAMMTAQGGIVGWAASSEEVIKAIQSASSTA